MIIIPKAMTVQALIPLIPNAALEISERCPRVATPILPANPPINATMANAEFSVYNPTKSANIKSINTPSRTSNKMVMSIVPIDTGIRYPTCAARSVTGLKDKAKNKSYKNNVAAVSSIKSTICFSSW